MRLPYLYVLCLPINKGLFKNDDDYWNCSVLSCLFIFAINFATNQVVPIYSLTSTGLEYREALARARYALRANLLQA